MRLGFSLENGLRDFCDCVGRRDGIDVDGGEVRVVGLERVLGRERDVAIVQSIVYWMEIGSAGNKHNLRNAQLTTGSIVAMRRRGTTGGRSISRIQRPN